MKKNKRKYSHRISDEGIPSKEILKKYTKEKDLFDKDNYNTFEKNNYHNFMSKNKNYPDYYNDFYNQPNKRTYDYYNRDNFVYNPIGFNFGWANDLNSEDIKIARDVLTKSIINNVAVGKHRIKIISGQKDNKLNVYFEKKQNEKKDTFTHDRVIVNLETSSNKLSAKQKEILLKSGIILGNFTTPNINHLLEVICSNNSIDPDVYNKIFKFFEILRTNEAYRNKTNKTIGYRDKDEENKNLFDYSKTNKYEETIESLKDSYEEKKKSSSKAEDINKIKNQLALEIIKGITEYLKNITLSENNYEDILLNPEIYNKLFHEKLIKDVEKIYKADSTKSLFSTITDFIKKNIPEYVKEIINDKGISDEEIKELTNEALENYLVDENENISHNNNNFKNVIFNAGGIGKESKTLEKSELIELLKDKDSNIENGNRIIECYGTSIELDSDLSLYTKDFIKDHYNSNKIINFDKVEKEYLSLFMNIFKAKVIKKRTDKPKKEINKKAFTTKGIDAFKFFKAVEINKKKRKKVTILIDCSGSMGSIDNNTAIAYNNNNIITKPIVYARLFVKLFSLLALQNACEGMVILSGVKSGRNQSINYNISLPVKDTKINLINGYYSAEGIESTMLCYEKVLSLSDYVFVITDAQICDIAINKKEWNKKLIQPIGIYVGTDYKSNSIKTKMELYFNKNIITQTVHDAMNKILNLLIES